LGKIETGSVSGWLATMQKQLAEQVARLADAAEQLLERDRAREQRDREQALRERWRHPPPGAVGVGTFLQAIPGLAARFDRVVPEDFIAQTGDGQYTIACPCGESPVIEPGRLRGCDCGRWFLHDGRQIHVALSPSPELASAKHSGEPDLEST
jgi:hypothetical protein